MIVLVCITDYPTTNNQLGSETLNGSHTTPVFGCTPGSPPISCSAPANRATDDTILEALPLTCDWVPWVEVMERLLKESVGEKKAEEARARLNEQGLLETARRGRGKLHVRLAPGSFAVLEDGYL